MFCTSCGREIEKSSCNCIGSIDSNYLNKYESFGLMFITSFIPLFISSFIISRFGNNFYTDNVLLVGSIILTVMLLTLLMFQIILRQKVSFIAMLFNCHQRVDRSFNLLYKYLPLCSRCTGIVVGILIGPLTSIFIKDIVVIILFAIPLILDGYIQKNTNYRSNNIKRFITGVLFSFFLCTVFAYSLYLIYVLVNYLINLLI